ncbi:unnamed protein product [Orchesella dallaii]|uniref:Odorant receptor n=1 Tax=Orchesella dallaii TaxID=48710 RepID=A0ABP1RBA3_9HEXA
MLSDRMYALIGIIYPAFGSVGIIPYMWDKKTKLAVRSSTSQVLIRYHFLFIGHFILYNLIQSIIFYLDKNYEYFNMTFTCFCAALLVYQSFIIMIFFEDDSIVLANALSIFLAHMHREYYPDYDSKNSTKSKLIDLGLVCILLASVVTSVVNCIVNCVYPHLPIFLGYILEEAPPIVKIPFAYVIPCIFVWIIFFNCFVAVCPMYAYGLHILPFLFKELRMGRTNYETPSEVRQPQNLIVAYRSLQLFQQLVNNLVGKFIVPTQAIVTKLIVLSSYMAIKHGDKMEKASFFLIITWAGLAALFWSLMLMIGGHLHVHGKRVLDSWKYHRWGRPFDTKLMSKFRKSCRPIMVSFGNTYRIRRLSGLKFIRGLSRGILRALLTL